MGFNTAVVVRVESVMDNCVISKIYHFHIINMQPSLICTYCHEIGF